MAEMVRGHDHLLQIDHINRAPLRLSFAETEHRLLRSDDPAEPSPYQAGVLAAFEAATLVHSARVGSLKRIFR